MANSSNIAHTPGPWHVEPYRGRVSIRTDAGSIILVTATRDEDANPMTRHHDRENAVVASAAPALAASLRELVELLEPRRREYLARTDGAQLVVAGILARANDALEQTRLHSWVTCEEAGSTCIRGCQCRCHRLEAVPA